MNASIVNGKSGTTKSWSDKIMERQNHGATKSWSDKIMERQNHRATKS
jgi:hypothetical protein